MKNLYSLALLLGLATAAAAVPPYQGVTLSTPTGQADSTLSGRFKVAGSSSTASTFTIILDGASGGVDASSFTAKYGVKASTFNGDGSALTALNATQLLSGTIPVARIGAGAVDTTKLASDAVTNAKIINGAVDTAKLGSDAVTNAKILAGAVDTGKLASDAVSNAKILNGSVDTNKLATDAITGSKILNGTISAAKLSFAAGTGDVLSTGNNSFNTAGTNQTFGSSVTLNGLVVYNSVNSSWTLVNFGTGSDYTTTQTSLVAAVTGSTVTLTLPTPGPVKLIFQCPIDNNTNTSRTFLGVLVDGAYIGSETSAVGLYDLNIVGIATDFTSFTASFDYQTANLSAATHNFCLVMAVSTGTGTLRTTQAACQFRVERVQ